MGQQERVWGWASPATEIQVCTLRFEISQAGHGGISLCKALVVGQGCLPAVVVMVVV